MAGFLGYRAASRNTDRVAFLHRDIVSLLYENLMALFSWHMMALLSRLIPTFFLWNILAHHFGNILAYLTRFIPLGNLFTGMSRFITIFFFGFINALHRGRTMDTIADNMVYKVAFSNLLFRALSYNLTLFDTLSVDSLTLFDNLSVDSLTLFDNLSGAHSF